jgi:hypothetical protein
VCLAHARASDVETRHACCRLRAERVDELAGEPIERGRRADGDGCDEVRLAELLGRRDRQARPWRDRVTGPEDEGRVGRGDVAPGALGVVRADRFKERPELDRDLPILSQVVAGAEAADLIAEGEAPLERRAIDACLAAADEPRDLAIIGLFLTRCRPMDSFVLC